MGDISESSDLTSLDTDNDGSHIITEESSERPKAPAAGNAADSHATTGGRLSNEKLEESTNRTGNLLLNRSPGPPSSPLSLNLDEREHTCNGDTVYDSIRALYCHTEVVLLKQFEHCSIKDDQPMIIKNRRWDDDLEELMRAVFGNNADSEQIVHAIAYLAPTQPLTMLVSLRSLVAAAICKWAMLPDPIGTAWTFGAKDQSNDGRTLDALYAVIAETATKGQMNKLRHKVGQKMVDDLLGKDDAASMVRNRASALGQRLYIAVSPFFTAKALNIYSRACTDIHWMPLVENLHVPRLERPATLSLPPVRSFRAIDQHNDPLYLGTILFQRELTSLFEDALRLRINMVKRYDGLWDFDFPAFKDEYSQRAHSDEHQNLDKGMPKVSGSVALLDVSATKRKIFLTTMFGVRVPIRYQYGDDYGPEEMITRAQVILLKENLSS